MKKLKSTIIALGLILIGSVSVFAQHLENPYYKPKDLKLYNTILHMDSVYFNAYNTCDLKTQEEIISDSMEFYHDKGGLMTSKKDFMESIKKNICGKVSRVLVPGSVEVYPIAGFGAVEIGYHRFINHQESETPSEPGRFVIFWKLNNGKWQFYRVASMHAD